MHRNLTSRPLTPPGQASGARATWGFFPLVWALYLVSTPFYLFPPGYPQPADGIMALLICVLLTGYALRLPKQPDLYLVASLFLGHAAIVNWIWWLQYGGPRFLLSSIYYAFNFGTFLFVISLVRAYGARIIGLTRAGLVIATAIALVSCLILPGADRATGLFNNPNQLGYWILLAVASFLVLKGDERLRVTDLVFLAMASYATALSLSKAALLSLFALIGVAVIGQGVERRLAAAVVTVLLALTPVVIFQANTVGTALVETQAGKVVDRLQNIGRQRDDSLAYRGYDRLWLYPQYLILGAGEGAYERFPLSQAPATEIHSTFGTLLFCYGIVGFGLLGATIYLILRRTPWQHIAYVLALSFYGLTHQGLRDTLLWVFLGLMFGMACYVPMPSRSWSRVP